MMSGPNGAAMIEKLRQARPVLLACEAIGWLHMTGKAHPNFLRQHGGQSNDYDYKKWFGRENPPFPWSDFLQWVKVGFPLKKAQQHDPWPSSLTDFVTKHTGDDPGLLGLLQAGHAMASGIEKQSYPPKTVEYLGQDTTHMWLLSPFGHPIRNLLTDSPGVLGAGGWQALVCRVGRLLEDLGKLGAAPPSDPDPWWAWREEAVGPDGWLREAFLSTLAETRLPNNDVTLWDQSYVAAALLKAAMAGAVLAAASNWQSLKSQTRWRVLTIGFGTDHYEARAVRVGDLAGAQRDIDYLFEKVRKLMEVDLALGSLVFRDTEVVAFTFPGLRADATANDSKGSLDDTSADELRQEIEGEIDAYARALKLETPPLVILSKRSTRSFVGMVKELRKAHAKLALPIHRAWTIPCADRETKGHVCPVCRVRFNGAGKSDTPNVSKQTPCKVCRERRKGRLDGWLAGETDTIWISEVADHNDRVALLSFNLDVESWLSGAHVDSLRAQSVADWRRFNPKVGGGDSPIDSEDSLRSLTSYVQSKLNLFDKNDAVLGGLQQGYRHDSDWRSFFEKIVEDRADSPGWNSLRDEDKARWIVHQLFRKLPSPGRIYRFWRTAETFFDELGDRFRELAAAHPNRWRTRRLTIEADGGRWEDRETYLGRFREAPFELLYEKGRFLTICNLARVFGPEERAEALQGETIQVKDDKGDRYDLRIKRTKPAESGLGVYHPIIVLDRSPARFRVLVPLASASAFIEAAIGKWRDEFGRVWDRMPLRVGIIAFPRLTPFQAVIEATRNVEEALDCDKNETWRVVEAHSRDGVTALLCERERGGREVVLLPTALPDGRPDVFYPCVRVEDGEVRLPRDFQHPAGHVYRHALDLRRGDGVIVAPSRIASVFLDTTGRRFESVTPHSLSDFQRMRDTWILLVRATPSLTALRGAWSELTERRAAWCDAEGRWLPDGETAWVALARAVLGQQLSVSGAALDTLIDAARDGLLGWAIEWHLALLKEQLET